MTFRVKFITVGLRERDADGRWMDGVDEEMPSSGMRLRQLLLLLLLGIPLIGMGEGAGRFIGIGTNSDIPKSNTSCIPLLPFHIGH